MDIITKKEAKEKGEKYYFSGKPCPRGHVAKRKVHNRTCYLCSREDTNKCYPLYYEKNKERFKERGRVYYHDNSESLKESSAKWQRENRGKYRALLAKYRTAKLNATPSWVNLEAILEIYTQCPENMVVDHIIPLQGKKVCGFHIAENLQYLTKSENSSKNAKFEPVFTSSSEVIPQGDEV